MTERLTEEQISEYSTRINDMVCALEQYIRPVSEQPKGWRRLISNYDPKLEEAQHLPAKMQIAMLNNFKLGMLAAMGKINIESYLRLKEVDMKNIGTIVRVEGKLQKYRESLRR